MNEARRAAPSTHDAARRTGLRLALALVALAVGAPAARAERADRNKPINVEADRMQYDDLKQVNVFTGNVTMTKGTIVIKGDRLVIRQDPEGWQYGTAYGNPASFRQKREGGDDEWIEGYALQLDYDGKTEIVRLTNQAVVKKLEGTRVTDEVHGNVIVYQSLSEFFTVESGGPATAENPNARVRVTLQPKNGATPPAPAPVELQPDRRTGPPRGASSR